jgi:hypothetical protein
MLHLRERPSVKRRVGSRTWRVPHASSIDQTRIGLCLCQILSSLVQPVHSHSYFPFYNLEDRRATPLGVSAGGSVGVYRSWRSSASIRCGNLCKYSAIGRAKQFSASGSPATARCCSPRPALSLLPALCFRRPSTVLPLHVGEKVFQTLAKVYEWDFRAPRVGEEMEFVFSKDRAQWVYGTVQYVDQDARQFEAVQSVCVCGCGVWCMMHCVWFQCRLPRPRAFDSETLLGPCWTCAASRD